MKQLGNRIKDLRKEEGLSPEELAEKIDFAKSTVLAYESRKKQVSVDSLLNRSKQKTTVELQNTIFLDDYNFTLDDQALNQQEIAGIASFIQVKRRMSHF